jgi:elongation factor G
MGYEFSNNIKDQAIPAQYITSIDEGVQQALERGILAGHPMVDIKVTLFDGSHHEVDSNEMAFKIAGSMALKDAARRAKPIRLEPVMDVEVTVPEEYLGVIIGDLNSRRAEQSRISNRRRPDRTSSRPQYPSPQCSVMGETSAQAHKHGLAIQ